MKSWMNTACLASLCALGTAFSAASASAVNIAYWDSYTNYTTGTTYPTDYLLSDMSASITGGQGVNRSFGSRTGTFGDVPGATSAIDGAILVRSDTSTLLTITLTNNTGETYYLESVNFDFAPRQVATKYGPNSVAVSYTDADGGTTQIDSQTGLAYIIDSNQDLWAEGQYDGFSYSLSSYLTIAGLTIENGESVTFTLDFGTAPAGDVSSMVDNILITGSTTIPEPATNAVLIGAGVLLIAFLRRRR
ncbi:MAG: hypothetical protein Q7Q73_06575 [Verrucomicrobiota bacterium JB024]|nr:hypothetical protein [Verrucomicrobiota bacterium JB024]